MWTLSMFTYLHCTILRLCSAWFALSARTHGLELLLKIPHDEYLKGLHGLYIWTNVFQNINS